MKRILTLLFISLFAVCEAQIANDFTPVSWEIQNMDGVAPVVMPSFDLETLRKEDEVNDKRKDIPFRFGYEFLVDYNLVNSGSWQTLDNGDRIWRIRFYSEGAKTMNFLFSDFYMPKGASLCLYSNDRKDVLGAYDEKQNNPERVLGTWLVTGEDIWLEYYEPKAQKGEGRLELFKLVHGYRSTSDILKSTQDTNSLNSSGDCHYDVNCSVGAIDATKDINKKSVAMIVAGGGLCTGALINNTNNNGTPYFLTANHCYENPITGSTSNPSQWSFRFNWISTNPSCASTSNSTTNITYHTVSGAQLKAHRAESDFCLLQITGPIDDEWDLVYAGWDRSTTTPSNTYGIHHPDGDIMKVSVDENSPSSTSVGGADVWLIENWEKGVTEGGSSGSPLFDNNGRIRGQLYGGESACNGTSGNGQYDVYGRLNSSWNGGGTNSTRLKNWLDPAGTNAMTLDYYDGELGLEDVITPVKEIKVYPNPSNGVFSVQFTDTVSSLQYEVYNVLGQVVKAGKVTESNNSIDLTNNSNGIYILRMINTDTNSAYSQKIVKR